MALRLKKNRDYIILHEEESNGEIEKFSFTFRFPLTEDKDFTSVAKMLRGKSIKELQKMGKSDQEELVQQFSNVTNANLKMERETLISWSGDFIDEDRNPILVMDKDGKIIEENQKLVYEFIRNTPDLYEKVLEASSGVKLKN